MVALILILCAVWLYVAQPSFRSNAPTEVTVDPARLKDHVTVLSRDFHPRSYLSFVKLEAAAKYIEGQFRKAGAEVRSQDCSFGTRSYRNVIGTFGAGAGKKVVIGAHYDSCWETPGADDNASGVAGLIELAYLFGEIPPAREIELVAYTLEEPPYFGTEKMGSFHHAKAMVGSGVAGVIVLEMIGYFTDAAESQEYPNVLLSALYPSRGNFIAVVGNLDQRPFTKAVKVAMQGTTDVPVFSVNAPAALPGIDFSDHRNYWVHDIDAVMVTDTAFYRNKAYHTAEDTADRLDYGAMARVTAAVYEAARTIGRKGNAGVD